MSEINLDELRQWIGRSEERTDVITPVPVAALSATLDHEGSLAGPGDALPPCWHWLYFQDSVNASALGVDGHPRRGKFLPPVPLPRRMWAASRVTFPSSLRVGDRVRRVSAITDVRHRSGRSGDLVFVTLRRQLYTGDVLAIDETQDIVYRGAPQTPGQSQDDQADKGLPEANWSRDIFPDATLLFRYSALTFNSHRIHYDRPYATQEEGYPSLVVQGPLTATLLLDLLYRELPGVRVSTFEFRALRPLLEGQQLQLRGAREGQIVALWALDSTGKLAMQASAELQG